MEKLIYKTIATTNGSSKDCIVSLSDGYQELRLSGLPKNLGGQGTDKANNPEQLLAAGYAACFEASLYFYYSTKKIDVLHEKVSVKVDLYSNGNGFLVKLNLMIYCKSLNEQKIKSIIEDVHKVCPYSNALKNNVSLIEEVILTD